MCSLSTDLQHELFFVLKKINTNAHNLESSLNGVAHMHNARARGSFALLEAS